ncbi:MAG: cytochrome c oxidase subunit II [Gemmatimonadetes bacterium]|nr:cytochrome c oxidase subunit II [Gemmatimonadota bacterium]
MKVYLYEKIWMWGSALLIVAFLGSLLATTFGLGIRPPSHVETIDPKAVRTDPRFAASGVTVRPDGSVRVVALAQIWAFVPNEIRVPAGRPVTFRVTSPDVLHGFQIVGTNVNAMVAPGYVSQVTTTFHRPGEYLIVCNEYCGLGHHVMAGKLIVEAAP